MPSWSDDEGRCHFDVDGEPCYQSAKGCPMHAAPASKKLKRTYTRAEVEALLAALEQVLVDINDPHPRTATLGGYRDALMATEKMVRAVLLKGAP